MVIISVDCEATGLDHKHGSRPYLVTTCDSVTRQPKYWGDRWIIDPYTRKVSIPKDEIEEIRDYINSADELVLQNSKFDVHMLDTIIPNLNWDWSKTHDIWAGAHVLDSSQPKNLTDLSLAYLSLNILPLEHKVNETAQECRKIAEKYYPKWKLTYIGDEDAPSQKKTPYKADMWLPRALAIARDYPEGHPYWTVTSDYANVDAEVTLGIWLGHTHPNGVIEKGMRAQLEERGLWNHYKFRLQSMRLAYKMECKGMSIDPKKTIHILRKYEKESEKFGKECTMMAARYGVDLELPKKGVNDSLRHLLWNVMGLEKRKNKKGVQSLDKDVMEWYSHSLPQGSNELAFIQAHRNKADVDSSISYLREYMRYWLDVPGKNHEQKSTSNSIRQGLENYRVGMFKRIYPNYSPYATKTLRWSGSNPNPQNIGKDEDDEGYSNRSCFAAEPGRELWSFDAKNVELRIPGYKSRQKEMISLFEESDAPPFYGSNHMLVFSILWPKLWEAAIKEVGIERAAEYCKKTFKASYYGWTKNFNFCVQYGGGREKADLTAHQIGAFDIVSSKFDKLSDLNKECIAFANKHGYIETIPDRTVDPHKGYPLVCEKAWGNQVKPTLPLNYQTQGSAMWLTNKVQIAVDALLEDWAKEGFDAFIAMQVHDEIVVDMPKRSDPRDPRFRHKSNLGRARIIQQLAERQSKDWVIHVPVPFGCDWHPDDWSKAVSF